MKKQYGFFSQTHLLMYGNFFVYKNPQGDRVNLTHITEDPAAAGYCFPDKKERGEVTEFVQSYSIDQKHLKTVCEDLMDFTQTMKRFYEMMP